MFVYMKKYKTSVSDAHRSNCYIQNNSTREQQCLGTNAKNEAKLPFDIKHQARQAPL
jgi:hypothetical protein